MAARDCGTYYKTWDSTNHRYLVKINKDDEWGLSPTPDVFCTKGRRYNYKTSLYHPPPVWTPFPGKTWDSKEGRWIFEVKADASMERIEIGQNNCFQDNENGYECTELIGVDITAVRKKYF